MTAALDGETFGHHHKWMDRGLAYALTGEAPRRGVEVDQPGHLAGRATGPPGESQVHESAWSCAHGVGRWSTDCGCSTGGAARANQRWRAPLRAALDLLRDFGAEVFERRGAELFTDDPWARARRLHRRPPRRRERRRVRRRAGSAATGAVAFTAPGGAAQRHAHVHLVRLVLPRPGRPGDRAGAALRRPGHGPARRAGRDRPRAEFVSHPGHRRELAEGDGTAVWAAHVVPARVDAHRVAAHLVLADLFELGETGAHFGPWSADPRDPPPGEGSQAPNGTSTLGLALPVADAPPHRTAVGAPHRPRPRYGENDAAGVVFDHVPGDGAVEVVQRALESGAGVDDLMARDALRRGPLGFPGGGFRPRRPPPGSGRGPAHPGHRRTRRRSRRRSRGGPRRAPLGRAVPAAGGDRARRPARDDPQPGHDRRQGPHGRAPRRRRHRRGRRPGPPGPPSRPPARLRRPFGGRLRRQPPRFGRRGRRPAGRRTHDRGGTGRRPGPRGLPRA